MRGPMCDVRQLVKMALVAVNAALISMGAYLAEAAVALNSTLLAALIFSIFLNVVAFYAVWIRSIPLVYLVRMRLPGKAFSRLALTRAWNGARFWFSWR